MLGYRSNYYSQLALLGASLGAGALLLADIPLAAKLACSVLLLFYGPGALICGALFPGKNDLRPLERMVLACGASLAAAVIVLWLLFLLPIPLDAVSMIAGLSMVASSGAIAGALQTHRLARRTSAEPVRTRSWTSRQVRTALAIAAALVVALIFVLWRLPFGEIVGDERNVVAAAINVLTGTKTALFSQPKGPAQMLLVMWIVRLTGSVLEGVERLPFALTGVLAAAAFALIAQWSLKSRWLLVVSVLFILQGLLLGMARFIQYQMFVLAMLQLSLYCALRALGTRRRPLSARFEIAAACFLGAGLLGHFDAALILPAVGYLFARSHRGQLVHAPVLRRAISLLLLVIAISAPFYVLLLQDPVGRQAFEFQYLSDRLSIAALPYNHLNDFFWEIWDLDSFYLAGVLFAALLIASLVCIRIYVRRAVTTRWNAAVACTSAGAGLGTLFTIWQPATLAVAGFNFSVIPFALFMASIWYMSSPGYWRALLLWIIGVLGFTGFLMAQPFDHYFAALPALLLAGAAGAANAVAGIGHRWQKTNQQQVRWVAGAATLAWLVLIGAYGYLLNIAYYPQVLVAHPERTLTLFPQLSSPRVAAVSYLVSHVGWGAVASLYASGEMRGEFFASTLEEYMFDYVGLSKRERIPVDRYWISVRPQKPGYILRPPANLQQAYSLWATISGAGEPEMTIYQRNLGDPPPVPRAIADEDYQGAWNQLATFERLRRLKANPRDDAAFRAVNQLLLSRGRAGDAIVFDLPESQQMLNLFYVGTLPEVNPGQVLATAGIRRVWGVAWASGAGQLELTTVPSAYGSTALSFSNVGVRLFDLATASPAQLIGARLGDSIVVADVSRLPQSARAGDPLPLQITWQSTGRTDQRLKLFVHVSNGAGVPVAQYDEEPFAGQRSTTTWQPNERLTERISVELPETALAGRYTVVMGLYDPVGGGRVPALASDGAPFANDAVPIGSLTITAQ